MGAWSGRWRLRTIIDKSWNAAFDNRFGLQFRCENLAARMLEIHMTRRYDLVVKPSQAVLYRPGCLAKMVAGKYICVIFGF